MSGLYGMWVVLVPTLFGVMYSVRYLPELLRKPGLSFHKAFTTLVKRDSEKCRLWIQDRLPLIYRKEIEEGWLAHFGQRHKAQV